MKPASQRLVYLDWLRGIGALIMLQGHVFHSFLRNDLRTGGAYVTSQFVGGMPPAIFLFLLGATFAFLMDSGERKGHGAATRFRAALRRSAYLFGAAFVVRLQLWLFAIDVSPWTDLLRVDILNCMGFALLILAPMAVFRTTDRIRNCAILGVAIAAASPLISGISWEGVPALLKQYVAPDYSSFGFFPWAAFVAFGMSFGSLLRRLDPAESGSAMQWIGAGGVALAFSAWALSFSPVSLYSNSEFWLNSPALVFIKTGIVMMGLALAWVWNLGAAGAAWSWIRQIGTTSMLVYWVHIELTYGRLFGYFKERLTVGEATVFAIGMICAMLILSVLKTYGRIVWATAKSWVPQQAPVAPRVPGD